jgi:hypothetical protein
LEVRAAARRGEEPGATTNFEQRREQVARRL